MRTDMSPTTTLVVSADRIFLILSLPFLPTAMSSRHRTALLIQSVASSETSSLRNDLIAINMHISYQ